MPSLNRDKTIRGHSSVPYAGSRFLNPLYFMEIISGQQPVLPSIAPPPMPICRWPKASFSPGPAPTHAPTSKAKVVSAHHLTCVPPMVPLLALVSASLLPWVKWEAESHSTPKFGHISQSWGKKNDSTGRPTTRAAGPDLGTE